MSNPDPAGGSSTSSHHYRLLGLLIFIGTFALYLKTMAPTVSFWDCGEFIACSYILGVPHPPGAPLYILLGRLFTLLPFSEVAFRVNLMSALPAALGIWCVYLSCVALARRALGGAALKPFGDVRDYSVMAGAALAALSLAVSYTYWFNAVEAEVYGYSILFTTLGMWLIFYWEGTQHGSGNDRWLLLIAYLFGLGGGIHMLCLLTIPSLMILAWHADERLRRLIVTLLIVGAWGGLSLIAMGPGSKSNGALGLGLLAALYYLYGKDRRACWLLVGVLILLALGYSTYTALYIRSGLNPVIDENDPETWAAFIKFLNREQYGSDSQLLGMLQGRASRTFQFWHLQMKYFFQQFPLPVLQIPVWFRRATEANLHQVNISLIPYLLGLAGIIWHAIHDRKRFWALLMLFVIMGFGLSIYLNMQDPQPRERHYVFGGMFVAFALWMGLAWTALIEAVRDRQWLPAQPLLIIAACLGLLLPVGIGAKLYHIHDRTDNFIAYDYAYNILQSCEPNSLLFTNGDNDTFPLWFLQEVEGIRRDVRVINLSLLNTNWYIKQLRDREPKVDIRYSDNEIDSVLTSPERRHVELRFWPEPKEVKAAGLTWELAPPEGYNVLRVQDVMVIKIVDWNNWQRPIHIAITVPRDGQVGLERHLQLAGMAYKLTPDPDVAPDIATLERNLLEVFRYRSITNPAVYKSEQAARLLINYRASLMHLAEEYHRQGQLEKLKNLLEWGEEHLYFSWDTYYLSAQILHEAGFAPRGAEYMERAGELLVGGTVIQDEDFNNLLAIAEFTMDRYRDPVRAARLFRRAAELRPESYRACFGLAAILQEQGDPGAALKILREYADSHGATSQLNQAMDMLKRDIEKRSQSPEKQARKSQEERAR